MPTLLFGELREITTRVAGKKTPSGSQTAQFWARHSLRKKTYGSTGGNGKEDFGEKINGKHHVAVPRLGGRRLGFV
jgi:hypothetical protein